MIQDIAPDQLDNSYKTCDPRPDDHILFFDDEGKLYVRIESGRILFPAAKETTAGSAVFLFSIGDAGWFLAPPESGTELPGFEYKTIRELRDQGRGKELFGAFTAWHLWRWYRDNRYCGRCGGETGLHETERALQCRRCGHVVYPRINPAVIVGVIRGDCLLITRYRTGFAHNALVAGFAEIGETLEETVAREVMEETGIRVKNIRYYKSQPWGIAADILTGFFCEVDGDRTITRDPDELSLAEWMSRDEVVLQPDDLSLTNEMMKQFRDHNI